MHHRQADFFDADFDIDVRRRPPLTNMRPARCGPARGGDV